MLSHYLRLALRTLKRTPFYSIISIVGIGIGLCAYTLLVNYTRVEKSFDNFHTDKDKIYRVESFFEKNGQTTDSWASSSFGYAPAMKKELPEVKDIVRVDNYDCERVVRFEDVVYREPRVVFADSNFFSFFSYPLLYGNAHEVLKEPNSIVISESVARKYFGNKNPVGKVLHIGTIKSNFNCAVTGVFKDFPGNSNLQLSLIMSYMTATPWERETWYMHQAYTYVKVDGEKQAKAIERKFPALAEKYKTGDAMKDHTWGVHLVPLTDIHLNPIKPYELETKGSASAVRMLFIIALVVLVISWVNYINIFISRALERAGEIGVRKMAGAGVRHIFMQFIAEALVVNLLSLFLFFALMAMVVSIAPLQTFAGLLKGPFIWQITAVTFIAGTFITGCIPAIVLKSLNTARVLKNKMSFRSGLGNGLRNGLILFQYAASIVLIVSALTIHKQIRFMQSQDLGIATQQTLVFKTPAKTDDHYEDKMLQLAESLSRISGVTYVTQSSAVPGKMAGYDMANRRVGDPDNTNKMCQMLRVDYNFLPAYSLQLIAGRNFDKSYPSDKDENVILTETAMQLFGFHNAGEAVNGSVYLEGHGNKKFRVIGVTKDFHQESLKENYKPIVLMVYNPWKWIDNHYVSVKLASMAADQVVNNVRKEFKSFFPESSFDFFFLDDFYNRQYQQESLYGQMVMYFSLLALFIVCLGLVGLSSFMLLKRKKEIGIRKVVGAGILDILKILNVHFLKLVLLAFCIASPLAWWGMHAWLQDFAYRTSIGLTEFFAAAAITLFITVFTVSCLSFKAASVKPVNSLRCD
jgi:putative ABC transport system permease protein